MEGGERVTAWKLRALVSGRLLVAAALVVAARLEHDADAGAAPPPDALRGRTSQGYPLRLELRDGRLTSFSLGGIRAGCGQRPPLAARWDATPAQELTSFVTRRRSFDVHQAYPRGDLWMNGRLSDDARRADGELYWVETGPRGDCVSGSVSFHVRR
jgi:hypothetical protein